MRTLAELIRWRARRHPDLEAIWYAGGSQKSSSANTEGMSVNTVTATSLSERKAIKNPR